MNGQEAQRAYSQQPRRDWFDRPRSKRHRDGTSQQQSGNQVMRRIGNLMKRYLYQQVMIGPGLIVLDLCCGKGQDLQKYARLGVERVWMIDQSNNQLEQAKQRYKDLQSTKNDNGMLCEFFQKDLCVPPHIEIQPRVDIITCQFALHYLWGAPKGQEVLHQIISSSLKPGGYLLLTVIDADLFPHDGFTLQSPTLSYSAPSLIVPERNLWAYIFRFPEVVEHVREAIIPRYGLLNFCLDLNLLAVNSFHHNDVSKALNELDRSLQAGPSDIKAMSLYQCWSFRHEVNTFRLNQMKTIRNTISQHFSPLVQDDPVLRSRRDYRSCSSSLIHIAWCIIEFV